MIRPRPAVVILAVALMVCALACSIYAQPARPTPATITITNSAIVYTPKPPVAGDHMVTVKNMTSSNRGIEMTGMDKGGTAYVRYSKILRPGKTETFRWFFPEGKVVYLRDITSCVHKSRTCVTATFGPMVTAVVFM